MDLCLHTEKYYVFTYAANHVYINDLRNKLVCPNKTSSWHYALSP